jgi:hypothetical protein
VSTQRGLPPQSVAPGAQAQEPPEQLPRPQDSPQAPQFEALVRTSTHAAPQSCVPAGQLHAPEAQAPPVGQAWMQAPQLSGSVWRSVQPPPQSAWPAGHFFDPAQAASSKAAESATGAKGQTLRGSGMARY